MSVGKHLWYVEMNNGAAEAKHYETQTLIVTTAENSPEEAITKARTLGHQYQFVSTLKHQGTIDA